MPSKSLNITRRSALAMGAATALVPGAAFAQSYPSRRISFVCAFPAGSGADVLVRYFALKVAEHTGATVIVENRPGAAGGVAAESVARSAPDGYTIYVHSGSATASSMWLLRAPPVNVGTELETIATVNKQAFVLVVRADSPYQTLDDLVADQKQKGDGGSYAAAAIPGRVLAEEFKQVAGLETVPVLYSTSADSLSDMASGLVDFAVHDPVSTMAQLQENRWRGLAIGSPERVAGFPDVPTFIEQGYDIDQLGWWGVMVPAGMPRELVAQINGWFNEVLASEETQEFLVAQGGEPFISTPEEAQRLMEESIVDWQRLIELSKIEPV